MKNLVLILLAIFTVSTVQAGRRKDRKETFNSALNYEIIAIGIGTEGTKYAKVYGYGKKVEDGIIAAKKAAVAAAIFKGIPGNGSNVMATPPLCRDSNAGEIHKDYFDRFFAVAGEYLQFVNLTSDGIPSGQDRLKIKGGYKIGLKVQIMHSNLRKKLEQDGIIKKLSSGF